MLLICCVLQSILYDCIPLSIFPTPTRSKPAEFHAALISIGVNPFYLLPFHLARSTLLCLEFRNCHASVEWGVQVLLQMAPWCSRCFYTSSFECACCTWVSMAWLHKLLLAGEFNLTIFAQGTKFKSLLKSVVCDQILQRANSYTFSIFDEFQSPLSPLLLLLLIPSRARAGELPLFRSYNMPLVALPFQKHSMW